MFRRRMPAIDYLARVRALHWVVVSVVILLVDYINGPYVQFPILFVIPVILATAAHGRAVGLTLSAALPLIRAFSYIRWDVPASVQMETVDVLVDIVVLALLALLFDQIIRQHREIQVLQGLLPICSFCKQIRDEEGDWHQLEAYISERSAARFSHTFCSKCRHKYYPDAVE